MELSSGSGDVELGYFLTAVGIAAVGNHSLDGDGASLRRHTGRMDGEGGIAQAEAEGIGGLNAEGIKIPVANVDSFLIEFVSQVAV